MVTATSGIPSKFQKFVASRECFYRHLNIGYRYVIRGGSDTPLPDKISKKRFDSLIKAGLVERIYSSSGLSMENLYGDFLSEIDQKDNVQINFKGHRITRPGHIFEALSKENLADDARTFLLVRKALENMLRIHIVRDKFTLNLEFLTPASLKENHVTNTEIEDAIDSPKDEYVKEFLIKTCALLIKKGKPAVFINILPNI